MKRLPLVEWWAWLEAELAFEIAWKRSAWVKWELDNVSKDSDNRLKALNALNAPKKL